MSVIRWSAHARRDLSAIDDYYAGIEPDFAAKVARKAVAAARFLLAYPQAGSQTGLGQQRKWPVRGTPYLIFYRPEGQDIRILRVRHAQQDWGSP